VRVAPHIVCAWATPRSVSTAFEKTFTGRGRTTVVHEPFTDCYYFGPHRRSSRYGDSSTVDTADGRAAIAAICHGSDRAADIFVKDLAFQAEPYLPDSFLAGVTNTFLLRHPRVVYQSLLPLKPDFTEDEFGFTALHRLFGRVTADLGQRPVIVEGTIFRRSPGVVLRRYCERVGLAFDPRMLYWEDGRIRAWGPGEEQSQARWHLTLEASHTILPPDEVGDIEVPPERMSMFRRAVDIYDEIAVDVIRASPAVSR
jgi:hypothetical protein